MLGVASIRLTMLRQLRGLLSLGLLPRDGTGFYDETVSGLDLAALLVLGGSSPRVIGRPYVLGGAVRILDGILNSLHVMNLTFGSRLLFRS